MIDVSSWQTGITVTTTGAQIVVAKATEGTTYVNPDCDRVVQQALAAGQGVGVYHFANTANSPQAEAEWFNRNTEGYIGRGIVPILDWEPSQPWNVQWAAQWVDAVRARWDTIPIIYMNQSTENSYDWSPLVQRNVGLWVAAYTLGYTPIYGFNPPSRWSSGMSDCGSRRTRSATRRSTGSTRRAGSRCCRTGRSRSPGSTPAPAASTAGPATST